MHHLHSLCGSCGDCNDHSCYAEMLIAGIPRLLSLSRLLQVHGWMQDALYSVWTHWVFEQERYISFIYVHFKVPGFSFNNCCFAVTLCSPPKTSYIYCPAKFRWKSSLVDASQQRSARGGVPGASGSNSILSIKLSTNLSSTLLSNLLGWGCLHWPIFTSIGVQATRIRQICQCINLLLFLVM